MSPQISTEYSKDLSTPLVGIDYEDLELDTIIRDKQGRFYTLTLYGCTSQYCLAAEVKHIEFSDEDFIFSYIEDELSSLAEQDIISEVMALNMQIHTDKAPVGRFVFNMSEYKDALGTDLKAVQVKGAFIEEDFSGASLACNIYHVIKDEYGCVMSDINQSVLGAKLWASSIVGKSDLTIYDLANETELGVFTDGDLNKTSEIWSSDQLTSAKDTSDLSDLINLSLDNKYHVVLLLK
jgi:hypothetical protein